MYARLTIMYTTFLSYPIQVSHICNLMTYLKLFLFQIEYCLSAQNCLIVHSDLFAGPKSNLLIKNVHHKSIIQPPLSMENLNPNFQSSSKAGPFIWNTKIIHVFQININVFDNVLGRKRLPLNPLSPLSAQKGYSKSFYIVCFIVSSQISYSILTFIYQVQKRRYFIMLGIPLNMYVHLAITYTTFHNYLIQVHHNANQQIYLTLLLLYLH